MRLLRFGPCLPVHDRRDPRKRLGWVPCRLKKPGPVTVVAGRVKTCLMTGEVTRPERIDTFAALFADDQGKIVLAVNSDDVPIETWRKVPGWCDPLTY